MANNNRTWDSDDVWTLVDEAISECNENGVEVEDVEPYEDYFTVKLNNDLGLGTINAIAKKVLCKHISVGAEDNSLTLFFKPGQSSESDFDGGDNDDYEPEQEEERTPCIPDDMRHTDRFYDSEDVIIPGTEQRVSNTEQCEQIMAWMKETGHVPIVYLRLDNGVHVEVSDIYDRKVKAILADGKAVGNDGRKYTFSEPDSLNPVGDSICVRAVCDETGRSDIYGLDFFV